MDKPYKYIIGIDEVGRGPIAGPVAVCAFVIKSDSFSTTPTDRKIPKLKDSKKLSKKQRVVWFNYLKDQKSKAHCDFSVSFVSSLNIDKFGISKCIQKALDKSISDLNIEHDKCFVYLDGGLKAPKEYTNQETVIKGDELHPVISCASIMAKVMRDRVMDKYAKEYPEYGFENHVGYGTRDHYHAIKKHGKTPIHRKTFIH